MATIIELNAQVMRRSGAHPKRDQTKEEMEIQPTLRWGRLYALGLLGGCLLIAGEVFIWSTAWRGVWDLATVGVTLAAIKLWVQANRIGLTLEGRVDITDAAGADATGTSARPPALLAGSKRAA